MSRDAATLSLIDCVSQLPDNSGDSDAALRTQIKSLVQNGADPSVTLSEEEAKNVGLSVGASLLHIAAARNNWPCIEILLQECKLPWNAVDDASTSIGQIAKKFGFKSLYERLVDEGTRAEFILSAIGQRVVEDGTLLLVEGKAVSAQSKADADPAQTDAPENEDDDLGGNSLRASTTDIVSNSAYLSRKLTFSDGKLLDSDRNAVMMGWETPLMAIHTKIISPKPNLDILNVGFGLGIIDRLIQATHPKSHTIIEAHPDVYAKMIADGWDKKPGVRILFGRWQDMVSELSTYDGIFFDTFGEYYDDLHEFHQILPNHLRETGVYSFFNGLAGTNVFFHDVACRVAELDLMDAGFRVKFETVQVDELGDDVWRDTKRAYWSLDEYKFCLSHCHSATPPRNEQAPMRLFALAACAVVAAPLPAQPLAPPEEYSSLTLSGASPSLPVPPLPSATPSIMPSSASATTITTLMPIMTSPAMTEFPAPETKSSAPETKPAQPETKLTTQRRVRASSVGKSPVASKTSSTMMTDVMNAPETTVDVGAPEPTAAKSESSPAETPTQPDQADPQQESQQKVHEASIPSSDKQSEKTSCADPLGSCDSSVDAVLSDPLVANVLDSLAADSQPDASSDFPSDIMNGLTMMNLFEKSPSESQSDSTASSSSTDAAPLLSLEISNHVSEPAPSTDAATTGFFMPLLPPTPLNSTSNCDKDENPQHPSTLPACIPEDDHHNTSIKPKQNSVSPSDRHQLAKRSVADARKPYIRASHRPKQYHRYRLHGYRHQHESHQDKIHS